MKHITVHRLVVATWTVIFFTVLWFQLQNQTACWTSC